MAAKAKSSNLTVVETDRQGGVIQESTIVHHSTRIVTFISGDQRNITTDISTRERHELVALRIVKSRLANGTYVKPEPPAEPEVPRKLIKAILRKLPVSEATRQIEEAMMAPWATYKTAKEIYERENIFYISVEMAIGSERGDVAIDILEARKNRRGEKYIVEDVTDDF